MVANKPPGILVDRPVSEETSLSDLVASYAQRRVRPLHRLDRDTSGLVMFALNAKWNRHLTELFEKKRVRKAYWAIVKGDWDGQITKIDTNIAPVSPGRFRYHPTEGKPAITTFRKVESTDGYSWIEVVAVLSTIVRAIDTISKREERIRFAYIVSKRDIRSSGIGFIQAIPITRYCCTPKAWILISLQGLAGFL